MNWEYRHDDTGYVKITGYTNATTVTATVKEDDGGISVLPAQVVGSSNATAKWSLGSFSTTTGFPRAIGFYEERLYFASTTSQPQTIFGSVSADLGDVVNISFDGFTNPITTYSGDGWDDKYNFTPFWINNGYISMIVNISYILNNNITIMIVVLGIGVGQ